VNAQGQTVGRLANQISAILKGKHKPTFQPNKDMGDHVVVINADKVRLIKLRDALAMGQWDLGSPWRRMGSISTSCCWLSLTHTQITLSPHTGPLHGQQMEEKALSVAHGLSRWSEGTLGYPNA
jgi:hypothetical protein